jgi:hypothetical protein
MNIQTRQPNLFVPVIMQGIADPQLEAFWAALPEPLRNTLRQRWNQMPAARKRQLYGPPLSPPRRGRAVATNLASAVAAWESTRADQVAAKQALVRREVARALTEGIGRYQPSSTLSNSPDIFLLVQQQLQRHIGKQCCPGAPEIPAQVARYSVKAKTIRCEMKDEMSAHDEVYLVTVAVDAANRVLVQRSSLMSMNAGGDDRALPNHYIYPPNDPDGFLDIAIELWEDDGGYEAFGEALQQIGAAIAMIPDPRTLGAGALLQIVGGLVILAAFLDGDDRYGSGQKAWMTATQLETGVGTRSFQYYNPDNGIFDTTGWHYFVDYELQAHAA